MASPTPLTLQRADIWTAPLRRGDTLLLCEGGPAVLHGPPRWLDGLWLPARTPLVAGTPHVVEQGGWVRLQVSGSAALLWTPAPPPAWRRWLQAAWRGLWLSSRQRREPCV